MTGDRYALHHDGTWFYYLGDQYEPVTVAADGEPMTATERRGWFASTREAATVTITRPGFPVVTGYRLTDPDTASIRFPMTLTAAEYSSLRDGDDEGDPVTGLYDRVTVPGEPRVEQFGGPWLRLDGEPPTADGRTWTAKLPFDLAYRSEYLHLFPGYMSGFRDAMCAAVKAMPRVQFCFDKDSGLDVTVTVPFSPPRTRAAGRGRRKVSVPEMATRHLHFTVPYRIDGPDRAAAAAEWDRLAAELAAEVEAATVTACGHCDGHGYVISGSENRERRLA